MSYNLIIDVSKRDNDYAVYLNNLASIYDDQGKFFEAQKLYKEVLSIKKNIFGDKSLSYSITLKNLALSYREQGNFLEAEKLFLELKKRSIKYAFSFATKRSLGLTSIIFLLLKKPKNAIIYYLWIKYNKFA